MIKHLMRILSVIGAFAAGASAMAGPEDDRRYLLELYYSRFPQIQLADYVNGALIFSADAKAQYDSMMIMPPWQDVIERGRKMWETPFKNGNTYMGCFRNGGKDAAGNYPYFDEKLGKVVTFEMAINRCRRDNAEAEYKYDDMATMGTLTVYARSLSDGMPMNIKVDGPDAQAAYEAGKRLFYSRRGQLNFACATCHVGNAGNHVRNEFLSPVVGQTTHWPLFRGEGDLWTLQRRYAACNGLTRAVPFAIGSEEYNNLEYFHSYMSNGLPMHTAVWRK